MSVLNSLERFIRDFSYHVHEEIEENFESIKQHQSGNREILENARILSRRLQAVSEIQEKYSRIFLNFANKIMINEFKDELSSYLTDISEEMQNLSDKKQTNSLRTYQFNNRF